MGAALGKRLTPELKSRDAADGVANAAGDSQAFPFRLSGPHYGRRFVGSRNLVRSGTETPDKVVMQVEGLRLFEPGVFGRNAMHINSGQPRNRIRVDPNESFLARFTGSRRGERTVQLLDMTAR